MTASITAPAPARAHASGPAARAGLMDALSTVRDPELDEPITSLGFVTARRDVRGWRRAGPAAAADLLLRAQLRLPDGGRRLRRGRRPARGPARGSGAGRPLRLRRDQRRAWPPSAGFAQSFDGEAVGELHDLRADFLRKAVMAGTDQVCRPLLAAGLPAAELPRLTLGDLSPSRPLDRLRQRRAELGLPAGDDAPLLIDPKTGDADRRGRHRPAPAQGPADPDQHRGQRQHLPRHAAAPLRQHPRPG